MEIVFIVLSLVLLALMLTFIFKKDEEVPSTQGGKPGSIKPERPTGEGHEQHYNPVDTEVVDRDCNMED